MQALTTSRCQIIVPPLAMRDGLPMADSRDVADAFRRNHRDVLRAYRDLNCSREFRQRNFAPFKNKDLTGESLSHILMTRSGFSFLVLGFTGPEAGAFKEAYIERFDAMDRELRGTPLDLSDPHALRALLLSHAEREIALEGRAREAEEALAIADPKARALDRLADTTGLITSTDAAKVLGMGPKEFRAWMLEHKWLYRRRGRSRLTAMQDKLDAGLLDQRTFKVSDNRTETQVYVTPAGLARLAKLLNVAESNLPPSNGADAAGRGRKKR